MKRLIILFTITILLISISILGLSATTVQAQSAWAPNVAYSVNQLVTYNGSVYKCIQAHTSLTGWEPPNVASLWTLQSGSAPTNTNTPVPSVPTNTPAPSVPTNTPAPTATTSSGGGGTCAAAYNSTTAYVGTNQVSYNGHNWQARWWTQGEAPSTGGSGVWQDLGTCGGGGTNPTAVPTAVPTTSGCSGFTCVLSESQFNAWFPNRNSLYTYANFLIARGSYAAFAGSSDLALNKREAAALFAHVAHETSYLVHTDELSYTPGWYCAAGQYNNWDTHYLCATGADYHGRGPLQLSWNYNYKMASNGQYFASPGGWITVMTPTVGADIWSNPNLVTQDGVLTWKTALWYWMNHGKDWDPAKATVHEDFINIGFGQTTRDINGGLECDGANPAQMQSRVTIYNTFLSSIGGSDTRTKTC
jgi:chitodextrinase